MYNSVFGKTVDNAAARMDLSLTTGVNKAVKLFNQLHFKDYTYFIGLYMIELCKKEAVPAKPMYAGTTVLELPKLTMLAFHYTVVSKNFTDKP